MRHQHTRHEINKWTTNMCLLWVGLQFFKKWLQFWLLYKSSSTIGASDFLTNRLAKRFLLFFYLIYKANVNSAFYSHLKKQLMCVYTNNAQIFFGHDKF